METNRHMKKCVKNSVGLGDKMKVKGGKEKYVKDTPRFLACEIKYMVPIPQTSNIRRRAD